MNKSNHEYRIVRAALDRKDILRGDDGYYVYWNSKESSGAMQSWELRAIADHLDRMNVAWDWVVNNDLAINGQE